MTISSGMPALAVQPHFLDAPSSSRVWTLGKLTAIARSRSASPAGTAVAIFEVLDDVLNRADREARVFVSALVRTSDHGDADGIPLRLAFHDTFVALASESGFDDADGFARACDLLLSGATMCAVSGDYQSAIRARDMARDLVSRHRASADAVAQPIFDGSAIDFTHYDEAALFDSVTHPVGVGSIQPSGTERLLTDLDEYLAGLDALGERSA